MKKIEAIIFDWAGTTVDYGCFAPVKAFTEIFVERGIQPTIDEVRKPMGMLKREHIRTMLEMPRISELWNKKYNRSYTEEDLNSMYTIYEDKLFSILENHAELKPYTLEVVAQIKEKNIKIGSTTGYTNKMMDIIVSKAKEQGYVPDCWISPDSTNGKGRPYPYMIFENLKYLNVLSVENVIKVGDTISDIQEGKNAGVFSVGVIEGSSEMSLNLEEYNNLSDEEKTRIQNKVRNTYIQAGADAVILNLNELISLI